MLPTRLLTSNYYLFSLLNTKSINTQVDGGDDIYVAQGVHVIVSQVNLACFGKCFSYVTVKLKKVIVL